MLIVINTMGVVVFLRRMNVIWVVFNAINALREVILKFTILIMRLYHNKVMSEGEISRLIYKLWWSLIFFDSSTNFL